MCTCRHSSRQQLCYTIGPQWNHCSAVRLIQVCEQFGAIGFTSFDVLKSFMYARTLLQKKETESSVYKSQYILYANFLPETSRMLSPHFSRNNGLGVKNSKYSNGGKRIAQLGNGPYGLMLCKFRGASSNLLSTTKRYNWMKQAPRKNRH